MEAENEYSSGKIFFQVHAYDDPLLALSVYNLIYTVAKPAGGILFGIAFWTIAKHLPNQAVRKYMLISAFGIMLIFAANQSIYLVLVPHPPFGLVTVPFMGLASYLFYLGIYSASISVSEVQNSVDQYERLRLRSPQNF